MTCDDFFLQTLNRIDDTGHFPKEFIDSLSIFMFVTFFSFYSKWLSNPFSFTIRCGKQNKSEQFFLSFNKIEKSRYETSQSRCSKYVGIFLHRKKIPEKFQWRFFKWFIFRQINVGCSFLTLQHVCSLTHERTNSDWNMRQII